MTSHFRSLCTCVRDAFWALITGALMWGHIALHSHSGWECLWCGSSYLGLALSLFHQHSATTVPHSLIIDGLKRQTCDWPVGLDFLGAHRFFKMKKTTVSVQQRGTFIEVFYLNWALRVFYTTSIIHTHILTTQHTHSHSDGYTEGNSQFSILPKDTHGLEWPGTEPSSFWLVGLHLSLNAVTCILGKHYSLQYMAVLNHMVHSMYHFSHTLHIFMHLHHSATIYTQTRSFCIWHNI